MRIAKVGLHLKDCLNMEAMALIQVQALIRFQKMEFISLGCKLEVEIGELGIELTITKTMPLPKQWLPMAMQKTIGTILGQHGPTHSKKATKSV